jgi:hypothetical protein
MVGCLLIILDTFCIHLLLLFPWWMSRKSGWAFLRRSASQRWFLILCPARQSPAYFSCPTHVAGSHLQD